MSSWIAHIKRLVTQFATTKSYSAHFVMSSLYLSVYLPVKHVADYCFTHLRFRTAHRCLCVANIRIQYIIIALLRMIKSVWAYSIWGIVEWCQCKRRCVRVSLDSIIATNTHWYQGNRCHFNRLVWIKWSISDKLKFSFILHWYDCYSHIWWKKIERKNLPINRDIWFIFEATETSTELEIFYAEFVLKIRFEKKGNKLCADHFT